MAMMTTVEKILAKATELEQQAAGLRLAAAFLSGEAHAQKRARVATTVDQAIALRAAQRPQRAAPPPSKVASAEKRDVILGILKAYGKPMPIAQLAEAARAQGIPKLTGAMTGYIRAGYVKKMGKWGAKRYTYLSGL